MKIAVMGSSGLLGSAVCREVLARGHRLLSYSNSNRALHDAKGGYETTSLPLGEIDAVIRELFDQWPDALLIVRLFPLRIWWTKIRNLPV